MYSQKYFNHHKVCLVLLHSGGMTGVEWQPQIKPLAKHFDLLIPDLPGHGRSLLPAGESLSVQLMAESVVQLLADEGVEKAHFTGSSMGGAVALWIAYHYPHLVDKLVIYRMVYKTTAAIAAQIKQMANPSYWQQYGMHRWLSRLHLAQGGEAAWQAVIARVASAFDSKQSGYQMDLSDLANITSPTLLIAGDNDPIAPLETLLQMYQTFPDCALWVMPKATHITASNTWRADCFAQELIRFLR